MPATAPLQQIQVRDFSGGPNVRDSASELAANELSDAWNVTFDERGGFGARLGTQKWNGTAFTGSGVGVPVNIFYSELLEEVVTQAGTNLYLGTTNTIRKTFTTNARAVFADFNGKVFAGHPVDGLFSSTDGVTWTAVADADRPTTVQAMAVWQNKLWVALANSTRVHFSDPGDGTVWTSTSFVDLREKDDEPVVAIAGAAGIDVAGRPGLVVCKRESSYRIHDSTTGAYETIDTRIGAASNLAVAIVNGRLFTISEHGINWTDGIGPFRRFSERFEPLWEPTQINFQKLDLMCAGVKGDRVYFSAPRAGQTSNTIAFEVHPEQGWIAPASNAVSCYTTYGKDTEKLLGGSVSASGQVLELYAQVGTDDGTAITAWAQTRWYEPSQGILSRLRRLRLLGRGSHVTFVMDVRKDYAQTGGDRYQVDLSNRNAVTYDDGYTYDSGFSYAVPSAQEYQDHFSLGTCKAFSLRFSASTTATHESAGLLGGDGIVQGAWAIYGFDLLKVTLGIA